MKSNPVKVSGKLFRYDFDRSVVEYIIKADAETIDAEIEWEQKHGSQLYGVGADGYYGIPFRRVCAKCYERIMTTTGYDGVKYDERDENLDADY